MEIRYCKKCGLNLTEDTCPERDCMPLSAPHDMNHLKKGFLQVMKYNSTIMPHNYRRMYLDRAVHRYVKTNHSNNAEYVTQLGLPASSKRVSRLIEILEGIVGVESAIGGNNENRKNDVEYLKNEYLVKSNFKIG